MILKNKNGNYEEEKEYGKSTGRITNGWLLRLKMTVQMDV